MAKKVIARSDYMRKKAGQSLLILILLPVMWMMISSVGVKSINKDVVIVNATKMEDYRYMYSFAIINNSPEAAARITEKVLRNCYETGFDVRLAARVGWKESHWKQYAIGYGKHNGVWYKSDFGYFQINRDAYSNDIHKLTNTFKNIYIKTPEEQMWTLFNEDVNIYAGIRLLKKRLNENWGNPRLALTAYNHGPYSDARRELLNNSIGNDYEKELLNEPRFLRIAQIEAGWKLQPIEPPLHLIRM